MAGKDEKSDYAQPQPSGSGEQDLEPEGDITGADDKECQAAEWSFLLLEVMEQMRQKLGQQGLKDPPLITLTPVSEGDKKIEVLIHRIIRHWLTNSEIGEGDQAFT